MQDNCKVFVVRSECVKRYIFALPNEQQHVVNAVLSAFQWLKNSDIEHGVDNFPAINEGLQEQYPAGHALFGRDRIQERPDALINRIHEENLAHIHVNDGTWKPETKQWNQTSKQAIVYSSFKHNGDYYFYVLELYLGFENDNPHDYYDELAEEWLVDAKEYREKKQNQ